MTKAEERRKKYSNVNKTRISDNTKIKLNLDMIGLGLLCSYIVTDNENVRRAHLVNLSNLMTSLDMSDYQNDPDRQRLIQFINRALEARLVCNIRNPDMIIKHINGGIFSGSEITLDSSFIQPLSNEEINWINNVITESLKFGHFYDDADKFIDVCTRLKSGEFGNKEQITHEFEELVNSVQTKFRKSKVDSFSDMTFSLREGTCDEAIKDVYTQLISPSVRLKTGMRGLNEMTGGGFESGRVYMFFGLPGEGKSTVLLNLLYQIKKYNKNYKPKDKTKCPCIVLLTMENTVRETIERLFSLTCHSEEMTNHTIDEVINMLRTEGELYLNDASPIDIIIKYKPDRAVDTNYLYQMTDDLEDEGYEVICLIQDYVKRIRSIDHFQDIRLELGAIVNEFKNFAAYKDIPVITASQLNREASKHIDEGRNKGKNDLVRMMGRSNIGESMLMLENVDCSFLIAPEYDQSGNKYMGIQRIKIRYRAKSNIEYIYHPFESSESIAFIEDQDMATPIFKTTLKPEMNMGTGAMGATKMSYSQEITTSNTQYLPNNAFSYNDSYNNIEAALEDESYIPPIDNIEDISTVQMVAMNAMIVPFFINKTNLIKPFIVLPK